MLQSVIDVDFFVVYSQRSTFDTLFLQSKKTVTYTNMKQEMRAKW